MKDDSLRAILTKIDVSRTDAAREIGISRQYLFSVEKGEQEPTRPVILGILSFLNRPENLKRLGRKRPLSFEEVFGQAGRAA